MLRDTKDSRGRCVLFRAVCLAEGCGRVWRGLSRPVQDTPLPNQNLARPEFSRMHLLGDEDVPGALLCGLHEAGIRRGSRAGARNFGNKRRRLTQKIERERERASEALDFEHAAALHKRLDKVSSVLRGLPGITRRVEDLNILILQQAAEEKAIVAFPARGGILGEPIFLRFGELSSEPRSVEAILRAGLEQKQSQIADQRVGCGLLQSSGEQNQRFGLHEAPPELSEHLSLIARWFYSNPREGEIFFREADWPYRRILRACGRLLAGPSAVGALRLGRPPQNKPQRSHAIGSNGSRPFRNRRRKPGK